MDSIKKLIKIDKDFSVERFKSYASNLFIQITLAIMGKKLNKVKHFISNELEEKYQKKINSLNENGYIQIYDELNVSEIKFINVCINNNSYKIKINLFSKSMNYIVDSSTKEFITGNNQYRTTKRYVLTFEKRKDSKLQSENRVCPNCGANIDVNYNGECSYCGSIYNLEDFNWILVDIKE